MIICDEQVLVALGNDKEHKRPTLPGGRVEFLENTEQGAVREVREET